MSNAAAGTEGLFPETGFQDGATPTEPVCAGSTVRQAACPLTSETGSDCPSSQAPWQFARGWQCALAGDPQMRARWQADQGGRWGWQADGLLIESTGTEWASFGWPECCNEDLQNLKNIVIGLTVSGKAQAAGLSFGHYKDFLADLDAPAGRRYLQLEVDFTAACWTFRVDGRLQNRRWWDSAVRTTADLTGGTLLLKARGAEHVLFQDLTLHTFQASCQLSVVMTCYRFLQRLRVALRSWCHQSLPSGAYEVLIVNPGSPDGTHEHLAAVAHSYPHLRVREVPVGLELVKNKGAMINRAVKASRGQWIWLADSDCLFPSDAAETVLAYVQSRPARLFYGQRRYLSAVETNALLAGRLDPVRDFELLCRRSPPRAPENAPWGYTQIVPRTVLESIPYHEGFNHFAHSDGAFTEECRRRHIFPEAVPGLFCLHLDHPFAWYGTDMFL